jgi:hypothetical protein
MGLRLNPWEHFILDNFLEAGSLTTALQEIHSEKYDFEIDYRGQGRIEFSLLRSPTLWKSIYSVETVSVLSEAFKCNLNLNKDNLLQLRRTNEDSPSFPLHSDYIDGMKTVVSFLYLSPLWEPSFGGRLLLHKSKTETDIVVPIEPVANRLVAFRTLRKHWHSVEKVHNWERLAVLAVWDVT